MKNWLTHPLVRKSIGRKILNTFLDKCKVPQIRPLFDNGNLLTECKGNFIWIFCEAMHPFVTDSILPTLNHNFFMICWILVSCWVKRQNWTRFDQVIEFYFLLRNFPKINRFWLILAQFLLTSSLFWNFFFIFWKNLSKWTFLPKIVKIAFFLPEIRGWGKFTPPPPRWGFLKRPPR